MRLEITRKTHLALQALWTLIDVNDRIGGAALASAVGTSPAFLAQVMSPLVRHKWVESASGPGGGYSMAVDPEDISILALIEAVEGPTETGCALRGGECSSTDRCAIHDAWTTARLTLQAELSTKPITSVPRQGALL